MATATTTPMMTAVSTPPEPEGRVGGREAVSTPPEPRGRRGGGETGHFNKTSYRLLHVLFEVQDILIRGVTAEVTIVLSS